MILSKRIFNNFFWRPILALNVLSCILVNRCFLTEAKAEEQGLPKSAAIEHNVSEPKYWALSAAALIPGVRSYSSQSDGTSSLNFSPNFLIGPDYENEINGYNVRLLISPLGSGGQTGVYSKYSVILHSQILEPLSTFKLKLGGGMWWDRLSGKGGTASLNNGTGVSTYALPGGVSSVWQLFLSAGVRAPTLVSALNIDFDMYLKTPFSARRTLGVGLEVSYVFF